MKVRSVDVMAMNEANVVSVVQRWKKQTIDVSMGTLTIDFDKAVCEVKNNRLAIKVMDGATGDMGDYSFFLPRVIANIPFTNKTEEELLDRVLTTMRDRIMLPFQSRQTMSAKKYYYCGCCNRMEQAITKSAQNTYPPIDEIQNTFYHKKAVFDYFRGTQNEKQIAGKITGYIASLLTIHYPVAKFIPDEVIDKVKKNLSDIGIVDYPEHAMFTNDEVILVMETDTTIASFAAQKQPDGRFKRVTMNEAGIYNLWRELTGE